jgi:glycosyltransferase involved in cell wall biosynthesis
MKILQTSFYNPLREEGGGVEQVIYNLTKNLSQFGHKVDITCIGNEDTVINTKYGKLITFRVPEFKPFGRVSIFARKAVYNHKLREFIKENGDNYDIIHIHGDIGGFEELSKFNTILTLHGFSIQAYEDRNILDRAFIRVTSGRTEIRNLRFAKRIIAVSKRVKEAASKYTSKQIVVIYNGIDCQKYKPILQPKKRAEIRRELGLEDDGVYILFVGTTAHRKGLDIAIDTIKLFKSPKVYLNIVGLEKFKGEIPGNVKFLGRVTESKKIKLYQCSNIFILPSRGEGFAIAPLEAMSCGLPVFLSKYTGVNEIIPNELGLVAENQPKAYYSKIMSLLKNKRRYRFVCKEVRRLACKYDFKRIAKQYLSEYYKLLTD